MTGISPCPPDQVDKAVTVLCDAFHDYPVMRYVLGRFTGDYDRRLRTLIGFFVSARVLRKEPVLAVNDESGELAGVALVTLPDERPAPDSLSIRRDEVWDELGAAERQRYEAFSEACSRFTIHAAHHHLNMIGVRRAHAGRGLARRLLESVHQLSRTDPHSAGVSLSTENRTNLALYEHFGYQLLGHARISDQLETWAFFLPS